MATFSPAYGFYDVTAPPYNAVGNGVADDSGAIAHAESDCEGTGGVVYFPPGKYQIGATKTTIQIGKNGIQWRGAGAGNSIILPPPVGNAPTLIQVGAAGNSVSDIAFSDLSFEGNGAPPTDGLVNPPVIAFGGSGLMPVSNCKIIDCDFQSNTGSTVLFSGVTNAEVTRCAFSNVGFHYGTTYFGRAFITPAIGVDGACINVRIHHNEFSQCQYDGIFILGSACEASYNHFDGCYGAAIDVGLPQTGSVGPGSDISIVANYVTGTLQVSGDASGIALQGVRNFQLISNTVVQSSGHGILLACGADGIIVGNICYDNGKTPSTDGCGIIYDGDLIGTPTFVANQSLAFIGNVCYDDQAPNQTQQYGLKLYTNTSQSASGFVLSANTFWGNVQNDTYIDSMFESDSNTSIGNTGVASQNAWIDRQHQTSKTLTGTKSKTTLLSAPPLYVGGHSLLFTHGVRVVAAGVTNGSGHKLFFLGLNTSGNLFQSASMGGGTNIPWQFVAYVLNDLSETSQKVMVQFWYGGALVAMPVQTAVNMATGQQILLEGQLVDNNSGDSIQCFFVSVERI